MDKKIVLGMSGGVDSSAAALLLKQNGWEVIGVTLRTWKENEAPEEVHRAAEAASLLGIDFVEIDCRERFRREVVGSFIDSYLSGKTPNPCVICNETIKWHELLRAADELGAECIATGHYAKLDSDADGEVFLCRASDLSKDQSYVLAHLPKEWLSRTVLPLAELTKKEIRGIAAEAGLTCADSPESQDICFIADGDYRRFLRDHCEESILPGDIVDLNGNRLGEHQGLPFYTIGQRRGIYVYAPEPTFVLEKDIRNNRLIVGQRESLGKNVVRLDRVNLLKEGLPDSFESQAMFRYRAKSHPVHVSISGSEAELHLSEPLYDIACGQLCVLYENDRVIGSGFIIETGKSL